MKGPFLCPDWLFVLYHILCCCVAIFAYVVNSCWNSTMRHPLMWIERIMGISPNKHYYKKIHHHADHAYITQLDDWSWEADMIFVIQYQDNSLCTEIHEHMLNSAFSSSIYLFICSYEKARLKIRLQIMHKHIVLKSALERLYEKEKK